MTFYRATSSLDVVELPEGAVLLRSDIGSCRIEGDSARMLAAEVLPRLSDWTAFEDLAAVFRGYDLEDVKALLDGLVRSSLLLKSGAPVDTRVIGARFLAEMGLDEATVGGRLAQVRVGIIGQTRTATLIRNSLESFGMKCLNSFAASGETGSDLRALELSKTSIFAAADELDLMIVAVDRAMLSARHWANQAALKTGCSALFADVAATEAIVGPAVLPGESGCYTCFRMRHLATSDSFAEVMAHEHYLDGLKNPGIERLAFPGLSELAAGAIVAETVRLLFPPLNPWLPNAVLKIDPLTLGFERHEILRQPDCPHCNGVDTAVRPPTAAA